jgi:uncharacterized protein
MKSRLLTDAPRRTWAAIFEDGDEPISALTEFAKGAGVTAARLTAVGGFARATVGYFRIERQDYDHIPLDEQVEVLSFVGDIALVDSEPKVHVHVVLGRSDGTTRGGHLLEGSVRPTLEVVVDEYPEELRRRFDPRYGIALIDPTSTEPSRTT